MRTTHQTRDDRFTRFAKPLVRAIGASEGSLDARAAAMVHIATPALMGGVWALPAPKPVTHLATWSELTGAEQSEAIERGFPRDAIFTVLNRYGDRDWKLVRWTRGKPVRDGNGIIRRIA